MECGEITTNPFLRLIEESDKWFNLPDEEKKWKMEEIGEGFLTQGCPHCKKVGQIVGLDRALDRTVPRALKDCKKELITIRSIFQGFELLHKSSDLKKVK